MTLYSLLYIFAKQMNCSLKKVEPLSHEGGTKYEVLQRMLDNPIWIVFKNYLQTLVHSKQEKNPATSDVFISYDTRSLNILSNPLL